MNGGTCRYHVYDNGTINEVCVCPSNFSGPSCESCAAIQCLNEGTCRGSGDKYRCICPDGFAGLFCEVDLCRGYCKNDGKCSIRPVTGPSCECQNNFSGEKCEIDNLCPDCNGNPPSCFIKCHNGGFCQKVANEKESCECVGEWTGVTCEIPPPCEDDECGKCSESSSINECV